MMSLNIEICFPQRRQDAKKRAEEELPKEHIQYFMKKILLLRRFEQGWRYSDEIVDQKTFGQDLK